MDNTDKVAHKYFNGDRKQAIEYLLKDGAEKRKECSSEWTQQDRDYAINYLRAQYNKGTLNEALKTSMKWTLVSPLAVLLDRGERVEFDVILAQVYPDVVNSPQKTKDVPTADPDKVLHSTKEYCEKSSRGIGFILYIAISVLIGIVAVIYLFNLESSLGGPFMGIVVAVSIAVMLVYSIKRDVMFRKSYVILYGDRVRGSSAENNVSFSVNYGDIVMVKAYKNQIVIHTANENYSAQAKGCGQKLKDLIDQQRGY